MKLTTVHYLGFTAMDKRFSNPMLPWIVSEIRKRDSYEQLSIGFEENTLQAYNTDFELQFSHKIPNITRFSQADSDPCTFLYLVRDETDHLLYCYLFQALKHSDVADLYQQMRDHGNATTPSKSLSSAANLTSLCVDISPSSSHFFEVLYIGKIKVSHKKVPDSFIDDALEKFKAHEIEKHKTKNLDDFRRGSLDSNASESGSVESVSSSAIPPIVLSSSDDSKFAIELPPTSDLHTKEIASPDSDNSIASEATQEGHEDARSAVEPEHNRTMVLQVGRTDLRLISPDRKLILLHKQHKDMAMCLQGLRSPEHFGFICKEAGGGGAFIGYVFKCESASVAGDAVGAVSQAFTNTDIKQTPRPSITSCEHCPMVWYHRLCAEIENLSDRKTQAAIFRRIDLLDEEEQTIILTKFRGAETDSIREQNEFLMMLLRAHCEMKQNRHMHDSAENRSEFLNQYLGGSTIFMKAKRSLSNSFDHLLKRKGSRDDFNPLTRDLTLPLGHTFRESSPHSPASTPAGDLSDSDGPRSRSSTIGSTSDLRDLRAQKDFSAKMSPEKGAEKNLKSPMMDIFMKVGNSPKSNHSDESPLKIDNSSWRQAIFNRVVTPGKADAKVNAGPPGPQTKRTTEELRALWRKAIHQAVLLVRMERENAKLRARQEESAVKRIKLEYDEMGTGTTRSSAEIWEMLVSKESRLSMKSDSHMLLQAIRQGVPRGKRGEVWQVLADQYCHRQPPMDTSAFPNYNVPYDKLLKQLTSHQHAILIDLGRTFPSHSYFSSPLGPGQLALFNLLKAYSLLDPEVGYCQGLSFVAGVLLLHMEEADAFHLLRHLMFRRGLRAQYLPDMVALQVQLYQLSRLLHDRLPDLYQHFDTHEVAPTLYAAPWLLTLFASQFPLGFVTRVFDLLFLESSDDLFKVALALLSHHREALLACDSFEEIMSYLKNQVPAVDKDTLEKVMRQVFVTDVGRQLHEYQVEYHVLQEEMTSVQPQIDALHRLQVENKNLVEQNKTLMSQLEIALGNVQRLERNRTLQQSAMNRLEMQSRGLEVSVVTLGAFIDSLVENKVDVEIPGEVRRIVSQLMVGDRRHAPAKATTPTSGIMKSIVNGTNMFKQQATPPPSGRHMVKSMSAGKISLSPGDSGMARSNSLSLQNDRTLQNLLDMSERGSAPLRVIQDDETYEPAPHKTTARPYPLKTALSNPNLGAKVSHFFSNSHSQILHGRHGQSDSKISDHANTIKQIIREDSRENMQQSFEKTNSLPMDNMKELLSPTSSVDSGVGTPQSPRDGDPTPVHPLSACDVNFTFNGTTKLKNIKVLRNLSRNSSPDLYTK